MSRDLVHPHWCARNYRCTVSGRDGQHLSNVVTFPAFDGRPTTVVSLSQRPTESKPVVEIRLRVRLTELNEPRQAYQIRRLLLHLDAAVREVAG